jgi:hypothetical protein
VGRNIKWLPSSELREKVAKCLKTVMCCGFIALTASSTSEETHNAHCTYVEDKLKN